MAGQGPEERTLNTFLRFWRKRSRAAYVTIWLSREVPTNHCLLGCTATAGMECMLGSAMYFICNGSATLAPKDKAAHNSLSKQQSQAALRASKIQAPVLPASHHGWQQQRSYG